MITLICLLIAGMFKLVLFIPILIVKLMLLPFKILLSPLKIFKW